MADLTLDQLNELCAQLFQAQDNETRSRADQKLQEFYDSPDCVDKCIVMLTEGQVISLFYTVRTLIPGKSASIYTTSGQPDATQANKFQEQANFHPKEARLE